MVRTTCSPYSLTVYSNTTKHFPSLLHLGCTLTGNCDASTITAALQPGDEKRCAALKKR